MPSAAQLALPLLLLLLLLALPPAAHARPGRSGSTRDRRLAQPDDAPSLFTRVGSWEEAAAALVAHGLLPAPGTVVAAAYNVPVRRRRGRRACCLTQLPGPAALGAAQAGQVLPDVIMCVDASNILAGCGGDSSWAGCPFQRPATRLPAGCRTLP